MKSRSTAIVITLLGGWIGCHKFYYGKTGAGFLYFLFWWTSIPFFLSLIHLGQLFSMDEAKFQAMLDGQEITVKEKDPAMTKEPENLRDVYEGMKATWKDPASRRKILKKTFFKHIL